MKLARLSDRIKLKIGEVTFTIAPVSYFVKKEIGECSRVDGGEQVFDLGKAQYLYIKHALKGIEGINDWDGNAYELKFVGDCLTDDCLSELFYMEQKEEFLTACWTLLNNFSLENTVEGVEFLRGDVGKSE